MPPSLAPDFGPPFGEPQLFNSPSSTGSDSSSGRGDSEVQSLPDIATYIDLDHKGVQDLLAVGMPGLTCFYTEEEVMKIFEGLSVDYVAMCAEFPPHSVIEADRRVLFFENTQWLFKAKKEIYSSTRKF